MNCYKIICKNQTFVHAYVYVFVHMNHVYLSSYMHIHNKGKLHSIMISNKPKTIVKYHGYNNYC